MDSIDRRSRIYITGHKGLVGSAMWRYLSNKGFSDLVGASSAQLDLRDRDATFRFFAEVRPQVVVMAAARVGGISANSAKPVEFISDNLRIQLNVLDAAHHHGTQRLLFLGSSCAYPKYARQPIRESYLLSGNLEPTNEPYAIAKLAGVIQVQALRREHGHQFISAMPTNLYGPGDSFDLESSHFMPALIRRFHEAKLSGDDRVQLWGSGLPRRELLHVDDLARACLILLEQYDDAVAINVGTGTDDTIQAIAGLVAEIVGYTGSVVWDLSRPDGTPRKLLDVTLIKSLGWEPTISLEEGIFQTYQSYIEKSSASLASVHVKSAAERFPAHRTSPQAPIEKADDDR